MNKLFPSDFSVDIVSYQDRLCNLTSLHRFPPLFPQTPPSVQPPLFPHPPPPVQQPPQQGTPQQCSSPHQSSPPHQSSSPAVQPPHQASRKGWPYYIRSDTPPSHRFYPVTSFARLTSERMTGRAKARPTRLAEPHPHRI